MIGWIAVDLDGTLAHYTRMEPGRSIGEPIAPMVARVKAWLADGIEVRIFTARASPSLTDHDRFEIEEWCLKHLGRVLPITATKDYRMVELWDDRAVRVRKNQGEPCCAGGSE